MTPPGIIGEYAKRTGVLLDEGDPIIGISTLLDIAKEQDRAALAELLDKHAAGVREAVALIEHPITVEEIRTLNRAAGRNAQAEMVAAAREVVKQHYWRMTAIGAAVLVAGGLVCGGMGAAIMWFVTPSPPELTYQDQPDGSRIGYYFVRPASHSAPQTEPATPAAKPAKGKGA